jgi:N-terminal acetyltransferase B complex catalytic subunit
MTSLRPFHATDVFKFNPTNLDPLTETYDLNFYFSYITRWPHLFNVACSPASPSSNSSPPIDAYLMGKLEASPAFAQHSEHYLPFHAHITALTVAPHARRLGLARTLSQSLSESGDSYNAWFVDLFVRKSNLVAQSLYEGLGYSVFRVVREYYHDDLADPDSVIGEDAYDMRKPLKRDKDKKHARTNGKEFVVDPQDVW